MNASFSTGIGILVLFFGVYYFRTQKIYSKGNLLVYFLLAIASSFIFYQIVPDDIKLTTLNLSSISLYYVAILIIIKKNYKILNQFLVDRKIIKEAFLGKEFTFTFNSDFDEIWDETLSSQPSLLDHILKFCLVLLPVFIVSLIQIIIENGS